MTRIYKLIQVPSIPDYVQGLMEIQSHMSELQFQLLKKQYYAPNRTTTATELARAVGASHRSVVNAAYGKLGRLFCKQIGLEPNKQENEKSRWWSVWSVGYATGKQFLWEMHQEVAEALEKLQWVTPNAIEKGINEELYARIFSELDYDYDGRHLPNNRKRAQFKVGWQNATLKQITYNPKTLKGQLSWNNLGYRFGLRLGHKTESEIYAAYEFLAKQYSRSQENTARVFPNEVEPTETFREGAIRQVSVNAYERDPKARQKCIDYYGSSCSICSFNFSKTFGNLGEGFIHVHHLQPISEIVEEYEVDPIRDLRPVCPNCHAMIHRRSPPLSVEEIKTLLEISNHDTNQ